MIGYHYKFSFVKPTDSYMIRLDGASAHITYYESSQWRCGSFYDVFMEHEFIGSMIPTQQCEQMNHSVAKYGGMLYDSEHQHQALSIAITTLHKL